MRFMTPSVPPSASRRRMLWLLGGITGGIMLHGCESAPSSVSDSSQPLISGVDTWIGNSSHYVAFRKDLFYSEGVTVKEVFFQSTGEGIKGFLAGEADFLWAASGAAIEMSSRDPSIRIIYVYDYSNGSDGIIGRGVNRPQDLKGKRIARENVLFANVLLRAYLKQGGLTVADVTLQDKIASDAADAFSARLVDAAVSYEPWLTKAAQQGGGKVIFTTKDTNLVADVIVTRKNVIETRTAEIQAYLRAIDKAVKLVKASDTEAMQIIGSKLGISVDDAKAQLAGVKLFDVADNKSIGFNLTHANNLRKSLELTAQTAYDTGLITKPVEIDILLDDSLVRSL
jgi:NitT/TauT family transport system substrate-binding protein